MGGRDLDVRIELLGCLLGDKRLASLHVLLLEQELSVQVAEVDGVEINLD